MKKTLQQGQALIALMFFMILAVTFATAAVIMTAVNSQAATTTEQGMNTARVAEGVVEDALISLIRDPEFGGGSQATISGGLTKTINVKVENGDFIRKFEVVVDLTDNELEVVSWKEKFE